MKRALLSVAVLTLVAVLGLGALDALLDHHYRVTREVVVPAPVAVVWPLVTDLPQTEQWSPFLAAEPSFRHTYGPETSGVGASYVWTGDPGWGRYEVLEVEPEAKQVAHLFSPGMGDTTETWTFAEDPAGTRVSWTFEGTAAGVGSGFVATFMDRLLGPMFDDGLARLATAAEKARDAEKPAMQFDQYAFVLLKQGPKWSADDTDENRALQMAHLEYLASMEAAGKMKMAGPFSDQQDESLRGLCIYATDLDEARALASADPRVQAGQLVVEVMTLWTRHEALAFPRVDGR
ncbi:MAG: SRPBCC family protein [Alphaproteobacteria bacterium]|nr:SRPBCC family protein [Alphaproteobacteria bacterium]